MFNIQTTGIQEDKTKFVNVTDNVRFIYLDHSRRPSTMSKTKFDFNYNIIKTKKKIFNKTINIPKLSYLYVRAPFLYIKVATKKSINTDQFNKVGNNTFQLWFKNK